VVAAADLVEAWASCLAPPRLQKGDGTRRATKPREPAEGPASVRSLPAEPRAASGDERPSQSMKTSGSTDVKWAGGSGNLATDSENVCWVNSNGSTTSVACAPKTGGPTTLRWQGGASSSTALASDGTVLYALVYDDATKAVALWQIPAPPAKPNQVSTTTHWLGEGRGGVPSLVISAANSIACYAIDASVRCVHYGVGEGGVGNGSACACAPNDAACATSCGERTLRVEVAMDGSRVYWFAQSADGATIRSEVPLGAGTATVAEVKLGIIGLALTDDAVVFVSEQGDDRAVWSVPKAGGTPARIGQLRPGSDVTGVRVAGGRIYVASTSGSLSKPRGVMERLSVTGGSASVLGEYAPTRFGLPFATDAGAVFWIDAESGGRLARAPQ
jgi:hypothetical protein